MLHKLIYDIVTFDATFLKNVQIAIQNFLMSLFEDVTFILMLALFGICYVIRFNAKVRKK